jgi:MoxR-like ATPase
LSISDSAFSLFSTQKDPLPHPFIVMATQNPIELEGTSPLPEAQVDRFLLKVRLGYPEKDEEIAIMECFQEKDPLTELGAVANPEEFVQLQHARKRIHFSHPIEEYITNIVSATRNNPSLRLGASPRGSLGLMRAGQALAALREREYVLPDHIKSLAVPVLAHRLILKEEERLRGETAEHFLEEIIKQIPVPVAIE